MLKKVDEFGRIALPIKASKYNTDISLEKQNDGSIIIRPFYEGLDARNLIVISLDDIDNKKTHPKLNFEYKLTRTAVNRFDDVVKPKGDKYHIDSIYIHVDIYKGYKCRTTAEVIYDDGEDNEMILLDALYNDIKVYYDVLDNSSKELKEHIIKQIEEYQNDEESVESIYNVYVVKNGEVRVKAKSKGEAMSKVGNMPSNEIDWEDSFEVSEADEV